MHPMMLDARLACLPFVVWVEPEHDRAFCHWVTTLA
jgi:hypothetical protein